MMITIQTLVKAAVAESPEVIPYVIVPRRGSVPSQFYTAFERLGEKLLKYETWKDRVSKEIFKWGAEVLFVFEREEEFAPHQQMNAMRRVNHLVTKILVNSLNQAPLQEPMLDREWVWEASTLKDYLSLGTLSPFDAIQMEVVPHLFAKEMLDWVHSLPLRASTEAVVKVESTALSASVAPAPSRDMCLFKLYSYFHQAREALQQESLRRKSRDAEELTERLEELCEQSRKMAYQQAEIAKKTAEAHKKAIDAKFETAETSHKTEVGLLSDRIDHEERRHKTTQERLTKSEQACESLADQVRRLTISFQQKSYEADQLRNQDRGSNCSLM